MSTPLRWISVDDTNPDIKYIENSWFAVNGSLDAIGNNGPPFLSTSHGTNSSGSFTFNFKGSGLRVMGSYTGIQNASMLDWTCFVDGVNLGKTNPNGDFDENHRMLCLLYPMVDGSHTVTFNATVGTNQTLWFDKIQYVPSASVSLENQTIQLDAADPSIVYGAGWSGTQTQTNGSQVGCRFYGVSVIWYGTETNGSSTTGTWSVDDNPPVSFNINGRGTSGIPVYNMKYFETPQYSMDSHNLIVTYDGASANGTTPLDLAYLVVRNGTLANSPSPTSSANSTSSQGASHPAATTNIGAIVGGTLAGAACLFIVILIIFLRHRRDSGKDGAQFISGHQSSLASDDMVSQFPLYQTEGKPQLVLRPHSSHSAARPRTPGEANFRQEQFYSLGPRKLLDATRNVAEETAPAEDERPFRHGQPSTSVGEVFRQEDEIRRGADAPPAYSLG